MTASAARDDMALLSAWQAGDAHAGNQLFERHFDAIYRFFRYKTGDDGADLVQRTFLGCIEARDRFRRASSFRTFLFAIARNELRGYWRKRHKMANIDFGVSSLLDLGASPSTMARKRDSAQQLVDALRSIPLEQQVALELFYMHGLSGPELAFVLEIPEGTVRSRLRQARLSLREHLARASSVRASGAPAPHEGPDWEQHLEGLLRAMYTMDT